MGRERVRKLGNLADRYPAKLTMDRLKSTHVKILIFDDAWIATTELDRVMSGLFA
ncbi:hypothetical protein [Kitasatospora sp. NPDC094016]|uniref:hypothetical protein n=1 Tax=Kitasatospora sp. NPDC094016 TaxID=3154986 RepID=UPI0033340844